MERVGLLFGRIGKFVLIPIGTLMLLGAAYAAWSTTSWLKTAVAAEGSVIEMVRVRDRDSNGYLFTPLVRFRSADGEVIEFQSSLRSSSPAYRTGQTVTVLYDPKAPNSAAIQGFFSLWLVPLVLGFIGLVATLIGAVFIAVGAKVGRHLDASAPADVPVSPASATRP